MLIILFWIRRTSNEVILFMNICFFIVQVMPGYVAIRKCHLHLFFISSIARIYNNQYLIMEKNQDQRQFAENIHEITQQPISDSGVREDIVPLNNQNYLEYTTHIQIQKSQEYHISQAHLIDQQPQNIASNSANFIWAQMDESRKGQSQCCDSCKQTNDKNQKIYAEMQAKIAAAQTTQEQYEAKYKIFLEQMAKLQQMKKNLQYKETLLKDQKDSFQLITKASINNLKQFMKIIVNCFQKWNKENSQFRMEQEINREIQEYVLEQKGLTFFEKYLKNKINDIDRIYKQQRQSLQRMRATIANSLDQCKKGQQNVQRQYKDQLTKLEIEKQQLNQYISKIVKSQNTNKETIIKNNQDIISLNRTIEQNQMFFNQKQLMLEELQRKIQELQNSKWQSIITKYQNELITKQIKAQECKNILQADLNNKKKQLIIAQKNINKLSQQKKENDNDYKYLKVSEDKRQQIVYEQRKKFKLQIINKLDNIIQIAQKSSRQNRQTINKQFNNLFYSLKEQIAKFNKFYDQFWNLEELYYNLSCDLIKKNAQISLKEALLKQSYQKSSQLIQQIKNLDEKLIKITGYYQKEMEQIKMAFQSKLQTSAYQIQLYFKMLIQNKQENTKAMVQILNEELTLANFINKAKFDQYEKQQQKYKKQIQSLEECIKKSEDTYLKQIKAQEQQINQKDSDLQLLQQKLKKYEGIVLTLNKNIHDLQAQANQKSKFLLETHKQLENKSLKQLLSQLDEQVPQHSRQLIDLMNCILYQQNQREKDINSLQLNIRKLQRQKQQLIAKSAGVSDQQVKRQRQSQKRSTSMEQKIDGLQRQIERLRTKTIKDQQTIEEFKKKLEQSKQQLQVVSSLEAQSQKQSEKFKNENAQMKSRLLSLQKHIKDSQKLSQDKINKLQTFYKEERAKLMQKQSSKEEIKQYDQKIQVLLRQNQSLKAKYNSQQIQNSQITNLKNQLAKTFEDCNKAKRIADEMNAEKLKMQRQNSNLQAQVQSITSQNKQLANRLKIVDEQLKFNQKNTLASRRTQQLSSNSELVKQAELKNQKLSAQIKALKRQNDELQQKLIEAQRQLSDRKPNDDLKLNERKMSWNESQNLMKGYEDMIQSLRQEKELLEQQIIGLKAKVKRLQGNNKIPKSYISPPKSIMLVQKYPEKINKQEQLQKNREQTYNIIQKNSYFGVNCVLDNHENGRKFLINKIQQIFAGKKFIESKLVYKYTEANKNFAFGSLLPKTELQSESFVFLFASKADIFGLISYKKDSISKQAALIFSINNQRTVTKRPTGDSVTASAVTVEFNGDLNIGNGHLKIKSSNRVLAVKEVLGKYFEQYEKKEIFGKDNWRDQMAIELTELQIHRIYVK